MQNFRKLLISFNKLLIFPLSIMYILINVITILNYEPIPALYPTLYYKVWDFCNNHGILYYFYWLDHIGMDLSCTCNDIISVILTLMMITDVIFSIGDGKKQVVKWILYGIMTVVILFIGFVASPEFYDSV